MNKPHQNLNQNGSEAINNVLYLIEKNLECTQSIILQIDHLIETNFLSDKIYSSLSALRNSCAMNIMNLNKHRC